MFNVRMVNKNDLPALQELYLNLHDKEIIPITSEALHTWDEILKTNGYYILIGEDRGTIVSSVTLIIIKNITLKMRPYALVENIVTDPGHRNKGYAGCLLQKAVEIAKENNCYKIMLMSGSTSESTINFYIKAGFSDTEKTGYVMRL